MPADGVVGRPRLLLYAQSIVTGSTANCPESEATVLLDLKEIGPTYFFVLPRIWESLRTTRHAPLVNVS